MNSNSILNSNQFGFRTGKSTSFATARVTAVLINKINNNKHAAFVLLDLKKAFDLINYELLLTKLSHYGIRGLPLAWLRSFLSHRRLKTKVNNSYSSFEYISAGVPQGSIVSPLLFILFINDIFQLCTNNIDIFLYADDTTILFSADNDAELLAIIDTFFSKYATWCATNCIVINHNKSNYLTFNSNVNITINDHALSNPPYVKYLGVLFGNQLCWKYQINHVTT